MHSLYLFKILYSYFDKNLFDEASSIRLRLLIRLSVCKDLRVHIHFSLLSLIATMGVDSAFGTMRNHIHFRQKRILDGNPVNMTYCICSL